MFVITAYAASVTAPTTVVPVAEPPLPIVVEMAFGEEKSSEPMVFQEEKSSKVIVAQEESLKESADRIAKAHGISVTAFRNLIKNESGWDPTADNGFDRGIVQINRTAHPEISDAQAFDPEWAMNWAASTAAKKGFSIWTVCNCYSFVKTKVNYSIPRMADIRANLKSAVVGSVAIFSYNGKKHVEVVKGVNASSITTSGANYNACSVETRTISMNDVHLLGFYLPS